MYRRVKEKAMTELIHEARRTGDGKYYLVAIDEDGKVNELYEDGILLTFKTSEAAKDHIIELTTAIVKNGRKRRTE
jgi:hypothetical protein